MESFKKKLTLEKRKEESSRIIKKYPDKLPIIVTKSKKTRLENIDKNKFLVPNDMTLGQFLLIIRKRIKLKQEESLFLLIKDNSMIESSKTLLQIYEDNKDEDGFLYITYCGENVFGN
jgi:GABA(A) receptor-associated protein